MAQPIESYLPGVRDNGGLASNEPVSWGNTVVGQQQSITNIVAGGSSATLTVASSGSLILLNCTSGTVITLPAPDQGVFYQFVVVSALASGTHKIITNASTASLVGLVVASATGSGNTIGTFVSGATTANVAIAMNGTTSGGSIGTFLTVTSISSTQWLVEGNSVGSGVLVTPFSLS